MADQALTLEQFKLACISDDVLTDEQIWILMKSVVLISEEDVQEFVEVLQKYRPSLETRFFGPSCLKMDQGRIYEEITLGSGLFLHRRDLEDPDDTNI